MFLKPGSFGGRRERSLAALEANALAAAGTGLLTVHTAAGRLAGAGCGATANALAVLAGSLLPA